MGSHTIKVVATNIKAQVFATYAEHEIMTSAEYEEKRFKTPSLTIVVYKSGKILAQGKDSAVDEFRRRFDSTSLPASEPVEHNTVPQADLSQGLGQLGILGSDETGTGSYFGDIVVVAVFVEDKQDLDFLQALGVTDSKALTDQRIRELAPKIKARLRYEIVSCSNADYNRVIGVKHNANSIKVALHNHALVKFLKDPKIKPHRIIVDGFASKENWTKYVAKEKVEAQSLVGCPIELIQKAESQYAAVAAASVLARYEFIMSLERDSDELGFEAPSGAGPSADKAGLKLVQARGEDGLDRYTKRHFKNTERVLADFADTLK